MKPVVVWRPLRAGRFDSVLGKVVRKGNAEWYFYRYLTTRRYSKHPQGPFISMKEAATIIGGEVVRR